MTVTIITYTQFGPYENGSTLKISADFARILVNQYGSNVSISADYYSGQIFDGMVLRVYPLRPTPGPGPSPGPAGTINVRFLSTIQDPVTGQVYEAGPLYRFTVSGLRTLNSRVGGLVFFSDRNQQNMIPVSQLQAYVGRTIYVDQSIFAMRTSVNGGNGLILPNGY